MVYAQAWSEEAGAHVDMEPRYRYRHRGAHRARALGFKFKGIGKTYQLPCRPGVDKIA